MPAAHPDLVDKGDRKVIRHLTDGRYELVDADVEHWPHAVVVNACDEPLTRGQADLWGLGDQIAALTDGAGGGDKPKAKTSRKASTRARRGPVEDRARKTPVDGGSDGEKGGDEP